MREIDVSVVTEAIKEMCISANKVLPGDLACLIGCAYKNEKDALPKGIMSDLLSNLDAAKELDIPICQDTGMAVIFAEVGQDIHFVGGNFEDAVNLGVSKGYTEGLLRCSVVGDPLRRVNTKDNTPAVLHTRIVPGDKLTLTVAPKGFGSENMSKMKMFTPAASEQDIIDFVKSVAETAGSNPCPPMVLGVGIGGDFEYCAYLAKKALLRNVSEHSELPHIRALEEELLETINKSGIGPGGLGGSTTALAVNINTYATHIAGLPVAINICCHVNRHAVREI